MKKILITGATGNIGKEVIQHIFSLDTKNQIVAGVRDVDKARKTLGNFPQLEFVVFDFENPGSFGPALEGIHTVFLLRPPHISNVDKYFKPLVKKMKEKQIPRVVFLSVQGAEKSRVIPHNKIEKLIRDLDFDYIFLRPSYFMQNLTTTLFPDIKQKRKIILPAGKAVFNWIDGQNIGETISLLLENFKEYSRQVIEVTGYENKNFYSVVNLINQYVTSKIKYLNMNPIKFYRFKRKEQVPKGLILVMIMLHFLPRFQKKPGISNFYEKLTGKKPTSLKDFIKREREKFEK